MQIRKSSGELVPFDPQKVVRSILRTGATQEVAEAVLHSVEPRVHEGMSTKQLYHMVREELGGKSVCFGCRYNLRQAILDLGPAGFKFEAYVVSILKAHGYEAYSPTEDLRGTCVSHEVDVVAKKDDRIIFIEAKFRNDYDDFVDLKDTMATWSRYLDLVDGSIFYDTPAFNDVWIVTNARFSDRATQFGTCKQMHLLGWGMPKTHPLAEMVSKQHLYPITVLPGLKPAELDALSKKGIILCKEMLDYEPDELAQRIDLSERRVEELIEMSREVVEG